MQDTSASQLGIRSALRARIPDPLLRMYRRARLGCKAIRWAYWDARDRLLGPRRCSLGPDFDMRLPANAWLDSYSYFIRFKEERAELGQFIETCRPGMTLFDVGAQFGVFSLTACRYGGPSARVVAFEPSPAAARVLRNCLRYNHLEHQVELIQAAVGRQPGRIELRDGGLGYNWQLYFGRGEDSRPHLTLPLVSVDEFCRSRNTRPSHIKIDVEGYEDEVLAGACELLAQVHPLLFLELHNQLLTRRGVRPADVLSRLRELGYRTFMTGGSVADVETAAAPQICRLFCH